MRQQKVTLYKYVKADDYLIENLKEQYLYLNAGDFNDPFELIIADRVTGNINYVDGLHILCLTNSYQNKLMWSHYADSHKGVCLTVELPKRVVFPVCYTGKRVYIDSDVDKIIETGKGTIKRNLKRNMDDISERKKLALIKDQKWRYEKEYRIIIDEKDKGEKEAENVRIKGNKWFIPVRIKNIYMGIKFEKNDAGLKNDIRRICTNKNISMTRMCFAKDIYAVNVSKRR